MVGGPCFKEVNLSNLIESEKVDAMPQMTKCFLLNSTLTRAIKSINYFSIKL
jgi:hypothetical protein